jgi:phosphohistidine phosphatase SixA
MNGTMKKLHLMAGFALAAALLAPAFAAPQIVYVTRHGEKAPDAKDPDLSTPGQARARAIAQLLSKAGIKQVFSSTTKRTQQTALPLAQKMALAVQSYDPAKPAAVVERIRASKETTLLVGHSNTVPELVKLLGGGVVPDIADDEFDRLYQLVIEPDGSVTTVLLTSTAQ